VRLLVLDQSQILPWIVRHDLATEPGLEVEAVASFRDAEEILRQRPPDAAVVSLPPAHLDWHEFQHLCASATPPVPVLYESCVYAGAGELGIEPIEGYASFVPKPASGAVLRGALTRLLTEARRHRSAPPAQAALAQH